MPCAGEDALYAQMRQGKLTFTKSRIAQHEASTNQAKQDAQKARQANTAAQAAVEQAKQNLARIPSFTWADVENTWLAVLAEVCGAAVKQGLMPPLPGRATAMDLQRSQSGAHVCQTQIQPDQGIQ